MKRAEPKVPKKVLETDLHFLQENGIQLVMIRDYFKELSTHDIDIICYKKDRNKIIRLLKKRGYRIFEKYYHKIYVHNLTTNVQFIFHIHFNAYETPHSSFLHIKNLLSSAKKSRRIPVLSSSQITALYLYKLRTGRPISKARKYLAANEERAEKKEVFETLKPIFTEKSINNSLAFLKKRSYRKAGQVLKFKNPIFILNRELFVGLHKIEMLKKIFRPSDFIVFIGTDGSGKTTTTSNFVNFFKNKGLKIAYEYGGRFKFRYLPLNWLISATASKKISEGQKPDTIRYKSKLIFFLTPFVYYTEYFLRYMFFTFIKRRTHHFVFADRSYIDVIISANSSSGIARFIYRFLMPKPAKVFFLYNEAEVLIKRRPEHDPNDIRRQLKGYHKNDDLYFNNVKTISVEQTFEEILKDII